MAEKANNSLTKLFKVAFPFFDEADDQDGGISYESGEGYSGVAFTDADQTVPDASPLSTAGGKDSDRLFLKSLPKDRFAKYDILQEMSNDSTIQAALNLHLAYSLSSPTEGGHCVYLHPTDDSMTDYVKRLEQEVVWPIAESIFNWASPMLKFGVNYVRPYAEVGKGITHFESNYYTLPNQIREYERSGQLAGFTSENLKQRADGNQVRLAEPWALIALKMPYHTPDMDTEPTNYTGERYSLYSDAHTRTPIETQNYGTSMLESAYESWMMLRQSIASLGASRVNAAMIDRIVTAPMEGLDPARAAEYINSIAAQFQKDREKIVKHSQKTGVLPTVMNRILPELSSGKGGLNIDTFSIDPNIAHIEDIMFHLKRMAGTLGGIDPSMLGFGDLLAGGLGEGGFYRTSIQSALTASQIRTAVTKFILRAIDIHTIYKDGKVWTNANRPFEIRYHSVNTALQLEQAQIKETNTNYAQTLATVLDSIEQSPIGQSEQLKTYLYTTVLGLDADKAATFIKELAQKANSEQGGMFESIGSTTSRHEAERVVRDIVLELISDIQ